MELFNSFRKKRSGHLNRPEEPTQKQVIGKIGEDCTCEYLRKQGFKVIDRNYLKKWGEIDIVAQKEKKLHFIEVKSVSRQLESVSHGLSSEEETLDTYRPEDNMHPWKLQRLGRVIQSYLLDKDISDDVEWQFDMATVLVDTEKRLSRVTLTEDLVL